MGMTTIASSSGLPTNPSVLLILLDGVSDAEALPAAYAHAAAGSMAISADLGYQAIKGADGIWHQRAVIKATEEARAAAEAANEAAAEAREAAQEASSTEAAAATAAANAAAQSATQAAAGAVLYATDYANLDTAARLIGALNQALNRSFDKRITELEGKVAALVN